MHHYIPIYIILKHGIHPLKNKFKKHRIAFTLLVNVSNLIRKENIE